MTKDHRIPETIRLDVSWTHPSQLVSDGGHSETFELPRGMSNEEIDEVFERQGMAPDGHILASLRRRGFVIHWTWERSSSYPQIRRTPTA